jgi:hypothetical protein
VVGDGCHRGGGVAVAREQGLGGIEDSSPSRERFPCSPAGLGFDGSNHVQ